MSITKRDCIGLLRQQGASELDATQTVESLLERKKNLAAAGKLERGTDDLAAAISAHADEGRIQNALQRRNTALTIMRRMEAEQFIAEVKNSGKPGQFDAVDAFEAMTVGSPKRGLFGARSSIDAQRMGIEGKWKGQYINEFERVGEQSGQGKHAVFNLLTKDKAAQLDFLREVHMPGSTGNKIMAAAADAYNRLSEAMRQRHNAAGANIGKLEGRFPQSHDPVRLLNGGQQGWVDFVSQRLDMERSFPGKTEEEAKNILGEIFHTLATGRDLKLFQAEQESFGPRNLASSLGKHRVLHFRDADVFHAYHEKYGRGSLVSAIDMEVSQGARRLSLMERLGPNPESMFRSLVENEKQLIRSAVSRGETDLVMGEKSLNRLESAYNTKGNEPVGHLANYMKVLTGETMFPSSVGTARALSIARSLQAMAKLGSAALSAMTDPHTTMASQRAVGIGFFERYAHSLGDYFASYKGDKRELARELGFLVKQTWGDTVSRFDAHDTTPGRFTKAMNHFYKWSGLDWVSEQKKAGHAMLMSRHIARSDKLSFDRLSPELRGMLKYNGVDSKTWDVWRNMTEGHGNERYFNPALARNLTDEQLAHLLPEHLRGETPPKGYTPEMLQAAREREFSRLRQKVETDALGFFADDSKFAVMEPDARATAFMTQGTRPGTWSGEAFRAAMQFKSWPIMFVQRQMRGERWQRFGHEGFDYPGMVEFMVNGLTFGYLAMTLKDISRGQSPRDPRKLETWFAAATQMGALGIYGDFFFGQVNSHGSTFMETAVGPLGGVIADLVNTSLYASHGNVEKARDQLVRTTMGNMPWVNLFYTRAAFDWLIANRIKEEISPGYKRRMQRERKRTFGQTPLW